MDRRPVIQRLPLQPGDMTRTWADVCKAGRLLGYRPTTTFEAGVDRFLKRFFQGSRAGDRQLTAP